MIAVHRSGLVVTDRKDHFKQYDKETGNYVDYDGDASYVVWNLDDWSEPKVSQVASYLPKLHKWLDLRYKVENAWRVRKALSSITRLQKVLGTSAKVSQIDEVSCYTVH